MTALYQPHKPPVIDLTKKVEYYSAMNEINWRDEFVALVTQFEDVLGARPVEMMLEDYDAGESVIAFENFLAGMQEAEAKPDEPTKQRIRRMAAALDCPKHGYLW